MKYDEKTGYLTLPGLREAVRIGEWGTIEGATGWSRIATDEEEVMYRALAEVAWGLPDATTYEVEGVQGLTRAEADAVIKWYRLRYHMQARSAPSPSAGEGRTCEHGQKVGENCEECDATYSPIDRENKWWYWYCASCRAWKAGLQSNGELVCVCGYVIASYKH